ncbi:MAG: trigger factor [Victivallaceae bacterium]|nr:trigger factor [Victivallaceae bacterium]
MSVKDAGELAREFDFSVTADEMKEMTRNVAAELANYVAIPGFRKGHAPAAMVVRRYESDVKNEVLRKLAAIAFDQLQADSSLDILNCALADAPKPVELDKEFSFGLKASLAPEIALPDYKAFKLDVAPAKVSDEQLDSRLDYYRNMYGNYAEITEAAQADDMLKVSYTSDFVLPENASEALSRAVSCDDNYLWLNEPELIPGAVKALTGAEIGKEYTFTAAYPEDWREKELAGKSVSYTVKVHAIQRRTPATDEELCKHLSAENMDQLKDMVAKNSQREADMQRRNELIDKLYNELDSKTSEFQLPADILAAEADKELRNLANSSIKTEADAEQFKAELDEKRKQAEALAKIKLRKTLILRKAAKVEDVSVSNDELDAQVAIMSRYYGYKEDDFRRMLEQNGSIEDLRTDILNSKVLEKLASYIEK